MVYDAEFRKWANSAKYDLILLNYAGAHIGAAVAHKMSAKAITFMPAGISQIFDVDMIGLPIESSWFPDWTQGSKHFFIPDHFVYTYNQLSWYFSAKWNYFPRLDQLLKILYPQDKIPPMEDLLRNTSLHFINEHFSTGYPRSLPPSVIPIGGMHVKKSTGALPKDVEDFVSTADRVIFISFGSFIKISNLPEEMQTMLIETVGSFNDTKFLWKWEGKIPKNMPTNILVKNWFPQNDILGHPKCKGFVSQGGQMSVQQAAFHGVPMIIVPVWADQPFNARSIAYHGMGIHLDLVDITKETFSHAIRELLYNPIYSSNAKLVSERLKDRPMSPVDTAVWWMEYVLRHDTAHLKSPGVIQYWWQRRLLDFYVALLFVALVLLGVTAYAGRIILWFPVRMFYQFKDKLSGNKMGD